MATYSCVLVLVVILACSILEVRFITASGIGVGDYDLTIRMPSVVSNKPDALLCTSVQLHPDESYIVKFIPHASKATAHHMMVYGCYTPANRNSGAWACDASDSAQSNRSVCGGGEERQILFAWALDAPSKALTDGIGLRVSGSTGIKHIVLGLHYARAFEEGETDRSGITLRMTRYRPPQQMGYYVLVGLDSVEPQQKEVHIETACTYEGDYPIYPIGYRTHSHNLGVVTAGYRIRNGEWTEIGRMSPQLPETFYNVTNHGMDIRKGDILAARCTMNSMNRTDVTHMGPTNHDEMCNFYIMYSTYDQRDLRTMFCFPYTRNFRWSQALRDYPPPPWDVSSLDGIDQADYVKSKFVF